MPLSMPPRAVGQRPLRVTMPPDTGPQGNSTFDSIDARQHVSVKTSTSHQHLDVTSHDISLFLVWWR